MNCERRIGARWRCPLLGQNRKQAVRNLVAESLFALATLAPLLAIESANARETILYSFQGKNDGQEPIGSLIADRHGNLFGVTNVGGNGDCTLFLGDGCGAVFELSRQGRTQWAETVIYSFQGGSDGEYPQAALVMDAHGNLYGTTAEGGTGNCTNMGLAGCGTVFELSPQGDGTWSKSVLYSFQGVPREMAMATRRSRIR